MKNQFANLLFLLLMLACGRSEASPCEPKLNAEFWSEKESKIGGVDLTYTVCPNWFSEARVGVSYFADNEFLYKGATGSVRLQFGDVISPYVGLGLLAGYAEKTVDASADGLDNNNDGVIDEYGEKKTLSQASGFLYPEVGVALYAGSFGITLSARRFYGSSFSGNVIYSLGLAIDL